MLITSSAECRHNPSVLQVQSTVRANNNKQEWIERETFSWIKHWHWLLDDKFKLRFVYLFLNWRHSTSFFLLSLRVSKQNLQENLFYFSRRSTHPFNHSQRVLFRPIFHTKTAAWAAKYFSACLSRSDFGADPLILLILLQCNYTFAATLLEV